MVGRSCFHLHNSCCILFSCSMLRSIAISPTTAIVSHALQSMNAPMSIHRITAAASSRVRTSACCCAPLPMHAMRFSFSASSSSGTNEATAKASVPSSSSSTAATLASSTAASSQPRTFSPRYEIPVLRDLPEYTYAEVESHNTSSSYWVVIDSHVYDLTQYHQRHPGGGIEKLFQYGEGTDRGAAFNEMHSKEIKYATQKFLIGRIKEGSVSTRVERKRPVPVMEEEQAESTTEKKASE